MPYLGGFHHLLLFIIIIVLFHHLYLLLTGHRWEISAPAEKLKLAAVDLSPYVLSGEASREVRLQPMIKKRPIQATTSQGCIQISCIFVPCGRSEQTKECKQEGTNKGRKEQTNK